MSASELEHVRHMWRQDAASAHLGVELEHVAVHDGLGHAITTMRVTEQMVNGHDICHGGYIFTAADSTFALACNASGSMTVASGATIDFVAPARLGETLRCEAREQARFGRSGITDVVVTRVVDDALVAHFRGRSRALSRTTGPTGAD